MLGLVLVGGGPVLGCRAAAEPEPAASASPPVWADVRVDHWLPGPARPGPAPARRGQALDDRRALEARCQACHAEAAREHHGSQHASAWTGEAFQAAYAHEPLSFCRGCHAPEHDPALAEVPDAAAEIGVGCVTCHVEPGTQTIWSARASPSAPHPVEVTPAFAGPQACAGCHEFEFPDARVRAQPLLMQATVREHAASAFADRSCADCHMPRIAGRRSHAFPGAYAPAMLAQAVVVEATRERDRLRLDLRPGEVGHAVPTGDLLRRLELRVELIPEHGPPRVLARRWLGRRFAPLPQANGVTVRAEIDDTRIGPAGVSVELPLPADAEGRPLRWVLTHERVAHASADPSRARIEGAIEFARGELP